MRDSVFNRARRDAAFDRAAAQPIAKDVNVPDGRDAALTHLADCRAEFVTQHPKTIRAFCGEIVGIEDLARDGVPTCSACLAIDDAAERITRARQAYDGESEAEAGR